MRNAGSASLVMLPLVVVLAVCTAPAAAWGGVFNRFSPEMLSNLGYGGHGGFGNTHRTAPFLQQENPTDMYQELAETDPEPCYGRKCTANEHCCPGSVCIDIEGVTGSCVFAYGLRQGELCRRDNDCESGLVCSEEAGEGRQCRPPSNSRKQYSVAGEECMMSSECDIHKGLCCQFQRRHRQAPRKVCSYFKDPLICIGPVASDQVKELDIEHTAGEKRLTGHATGGAAAFNHIRR
ncbi:ITG-like peptide isoform X3 [Thrips palmi]|uniref:ITG-like peptide isoform X3 n=1 Tax=Thrips palmi TaxID=161013 RepID=A0A6P8YRV0_THRPL|nr:ITG-like peptide isoform X3 [Thrips palmi]